MSHEVRIFAYAVARCQDDGSDITVVSHSWSTSDAVMADAVVDAVHAFLGEPEQEKLFDEAAARAMHEATLNSGAVTLNSGDGP